MTSKFLYLSSRHIKPLFARDVSELSLVISARVDLIVTGGEKSMIVLLGEPRLWGAFPAKSSSVWSGASIGPCDVELDAASAVSELKSAAPLGSILHKGDCLYLQVSSNTSSFYEPVSLPLEIEPGGSRQEFGLWFPRWRLVLKEGDERYVVRDFDVSPKTE